MIMLLPNTCVYSPGSVDLNDKQIRYVRHYINGLEKELERTFNAKTQINVSRNIRESKQNVGEVIDMLSKGQLWELISDPFKDDFNKILSYRNTKKGNLYMWVDNYQVIHIIDGEPQEDIDTLDIRGPIIEHIPQLIAECPTDMGEIVVMNISLWFRNLPIAVIQKNE